MLESVHSPGAYTIILSDVLEIFLFGIYSIFFLFAMIILTVYKRPLPIDWGVVLATCAAFVTCMAHCSIVTTDRYSAFTSGWPAPSGRDMSGLLRFGNILFKICGFLSQLIMIHRCWAVWDRRFSVVVVPLIMALSGIVCALLGPARLSATRFNSPFVAPRTMSFDIAFFSLSLAVEVLVTALITIHLRRISAPVRNVESMETVIWHLVGACIEAGALLVVAELWVVILLVLNRPTIIIAEGVTAQIYGIAPTMMIIRLGLSLVPRDRRRWDSTNPQFSTFVISTMYSPEDSDNANAD